MNEKPFKLDFDFGEALARLVRVPKPPPNPNRKKATGSRNPVAKKAPPIDTGGENVGK